MTSAQSESDLVHSYARTSSRLRGSQVQTFSFQHYQRIIPRRIYFIYHLILALNSFPTIVRCPSAAQLGSSLLQQNLRMKEDRKAKEMRDKIKEKRNKKSGDKAQDFLQQAFEKIGDYKILLDKLIGEGTYGRVYKAKKQDSNEQLACKVISKNKLQSLKMYREDYAQQLQRRFKTESEFHKKLSGCPHIVKLVDTIENNKAYYFIMQYCESDLSKVIKQNGTLSEEVALNYFAQMVEGYKSIYSNNAFHRDLKPQNLLVKDDSIKISDFGFVKIFSEMDLQKECRSGKNKLRTESKVGSIKYMSPDVLNLASDNSSTSTYNAQKSDIWSMGIILYKMLYGKEPFSGKDEEQMIKIISEKQLTFPDTAKISPEVIKNTNVSSEVKRLIKKMIEKNEESRISFKKLYSKVQELNSSKELDKQQKKARGLQGEGRGVRQGEAKNKKQELLIFYNKIMIQLYHDSVNYASLRQIGIQNYHEITCKLMTLIHQKRVNFLESEDDESQQEVNDKIKQEISSYHNSFAIAIKNIAKLQQQDSLQKILLGIYHKIKQYDEFELLMNQVLIFLINLLLLLSLELKIFEPNFVYIESMHLDKKKKDVILKYWQSTLKNIFKKLNGQQQPEFKDRKHKEKKHRSKDRDNDKKAKSPSVEKDKDQKEDRHKKSREKSHDRHKSKDKKSKR